MSTTTQPIDPQPPATCRGFEPIISRPDDWYDFVEVGGGYDAIFLRCPFGRIAGVRVERVQGVWVWVLQPEQRQ